MCSCLRARATRCTQDAARRSSPAFACKRAGSCCVWATGLGFAHSSKIRTSNAIGGLRAKGAKEARVLRRSPTRDIYVEAPSCARVGNSGREHEVFNAKSRRSHCIFGRFHLFITMFAKTRRHILIGRSVYQLCEIIEVFISLSLRITYKV